MNKKDQKKALQTLGYDPSKFKVMKTLGMNEETWKLASEERKMVDNLSINRWRLKAVITQSTRMRSGTV